LGVLGNGKLVAACATGVGPEERRSAVTLIQVRSSSRETKHNPAVYAAGIVYDVQLLRALTCLPILVVSPTEIARKSDSGT
jgi:hypothetical protein